MSAYIFLKKIVKAGLKRTDIVIMYIMSRFSLTSTLYYVFFNRNFHREHQYILKGRLEYYHNNLDMKNSQALLRRNIHRIEKGLIMSPRRDLFATEYILETVNALYSDMKKKHITEWDANWYVCVLDKYFEVVGSEPRIDAARSRFLSLVKELNLSENLSCDCVPYSKNSGVTSDISTEQLERLFQQRRSVRWFLNKDVDIASIKHAVSIAKMAPSACNRQPFRFHIIADRQMVKEVSECAMGTVGFSHQFPMLILVVGDLSYYESERDRHLIYIDGSLVAMQFTLALETMSLSSCMINWPDIEHRERKLNKLMELSSYERAVMLIAVGYADPNGLIPFSQKKEDDELIKVWTK